MLNSMDKIQSSRPLGLKGQKNIQNMHKNKFQDFLDEKLLEIPAIESKKARVELSGVLKTTKMTLGENWISHFHLETNDSELLLKIKKNHLELAKKHLWDEVRVRGYFDDSGRILNVESIIPTPVNSESPYLNYDSDWELERYQNRIRQGEFLKMEFEYLAS